MKIFIAICFFFIISFNVAHAEENAEKEYTITAETLTYVPEKSSIFLRGNVKVISSIFVVYAQEVDVILLTTQEDMNSFSSENIKEILFRKDLNFTYNISTKGKGDRARFDVAKNILVVSGNVTIDSEGNIIEGDEVEVDITTYDTNVKGNRKKPVEILIKSKDIKDIGNR